MAISQTAVTEVVSKEDLRRLHVGIKELNDEQIKQLPVLYVSELKRLAKTVNRAFGCDSILR